jgi:hypothetical protein
VKRSAVSVVLVVALLVAVAAPAQAGAQQSCPIQVSASGPLGIVLGGMLALAQIVLSKFLVMAWDSTNQTCNITGLTDEGQTLVSDLGEAAKYGSRLVAELLRLLSGGG